MNTQRVRSGLLSNCGWLLAELGGRCKSYIVNDKAEREWAEFAWVEAVAELGAQQNRERQNGAKKMRLFFDASEQRVRSLQDFVSLHGVTG